MRSDRPKKDNRSRVMRRSGTKTKAVRYGGKVDRMKAVKSKYAKHSKECACSRCRKRAERRKIFPLIG